MEKVQGSIKELSELFAQLAFFNNDLNKKLITGKVKLFLLVLI